MKKYKISNNIDFSLKEFDFVNVESAVRYVIENPFEFVTYKLLDSKQIFIYEMLEDGEYYIAAFVNNALLGDYHISVKEVLK